MEQQDKNILNMPMLALRGLVLFPHMILHFDVGRQKSIAAVQHAMQTGTPIFLVAQRDIRDEDPTPDQLFEVGCIAMVRQTLKLPGENIRVLVEGTDRARLMRVWQQEPYAQVEVECFPEVKHPFQSPREEAELRGLQELFEDYMSYAPRMNQEAVLNVVSADDLAQLADYIAQNMGTKYTDKQTILETIDPIRRTERLTALLMREIEVLDAEQDIQQKVHDQMDKNQKDYYLREQIKVIQSELGEGDDAAAEAEKYRARIRALHLDAENEEKLLTEADRMGRMQAMSPESGVIRTYLDTVLELPWNKTTSEKPDVAAAKKILDADHYGLEKVKDRILEYVAVRQLSPDLKGQILCLVGPPGVGKTSIGRSIARALHRKYARLSLGGVRDEAEIRGHRKTYIGAMPGRIMTALRQAGSKNALLLLDEVDKLGNDFRGDPASALLEVLDAEQNSAFRDHYIELPFDLSQVLFVVTANTTATIPRPLLDRMEVIHLSSYTDEEKVQIARQHLLPRQCKRHGLRRTQLRMDDDTLRALIHGYTRESGVRNLERELAQLVRRTARYLVEHPESKSVKITAANLCDFAGPAKIHDSRTYTGSEVGVVNGLAWTEVGGELLEAEVAITDGSGQLKLTGNLGDVMKESAMAALTYIRSRAAAFGIEPDFYKKKDIHIHFPEGAVPKDGPSAGVTVTTAMVSALTGIPVRRDVAMTGEVTLRGRVLPIGGLREKSMAALRAGILTVLIPEDNVPDLEEIDPLVREKLTFIPASQVDTVLSHALLQMPTPKPADAVPDASAKSEKPAEELPAAVPGDSHLHIHS